MGILLQVAFEQIVDAVFLDEVARNRECEVRRSAGHSHQPGIAAGKQMDLDLAARAAVTGQIDLQSDELSRRRIEAGDAKPSRGPGVAAVGGDEEPRVKLVFGAFGLENPAAVIALDRLQFAAFEERRARADDALNQQMIEDAARHAEAEDARAAP